MSLAVTRADHDVVDLDGGEYVMGSDRHHPADAPAHRVRVGAFAIDPARPKFRIPRKVITGGSHLCADSYCLRYRPASRRLRRIDTGISHIGFRCAGPAAPSHDPSPRSTREQP